MKGFIEQTSRLLLGVIAVAFVVAGGIAIAFGAASMNNTLPDAVAAYAAPTLHAAYFLICLGIFIILVAFIALLGAIKESKVVLVTFGIVIVLLLVVEIAAFIYYAVYTSKFEQNLGKLWTDASEEDRCAIEVEFECKGWATTSDRTAVDCEKAAGEVANGACRAAVLNRVRKYSDEVMIALGLVAAIQVLALACATCIVRRKQPETAGGSQAPPKKEPPRRRRSQRRT